MGQLSLCFFLFPLPVICWLTTTKAPHFGQVTHEHAMRSAIPELYGDLSREVAVARHIQEARPSWGTRFVLSPARHYSLRRASNTPRAIMEGELVCRRHWHSREKFLDLLGASNLIPEPYTTHCNRETGPNPGSSQPSTKVTFNKTIVFSRMILAVFLPLAVRSN